MARYQRSTEIHGNADALFAYPSDVGNLPKYMDQMTSAESTGGEKIRTTAEVDVSGDGDTSTASVTIHTEHDEEGNDIDDGLKGTLANIKRLVEAA